MLLPKKRVVALSAAKLQPPMTGNTPDMTGAAAGVAGLLTSMRPGPILPLAPASRNLKHTRAPSLLRLNPSQLPISLTPGRRYITASLFATLSYTSTEYLPPDTE